MAVQDGLVETHAARFDARDYVRMVMRRWWFIAAVAVAAAVVGSFISLGMPKTYRASATVVVPQEPSGVVLLGGTPTSPGEPIALETQAVIAAGNETAVRTAKALAERSVGPKIIVDPKQITAAITASIKSPQMLVITAESENELWAREFANQTAQCFLEIMDELHQKESTNAQRYLLKQIDTTRRELDQLLLRKRQYQREWGISTSVAFGSPSGKQPATMAIVPETADFRTALNQAQADLAAMQARLATLREAERKAEAEKTIRTVVTNPTYLSLLDQQNTAQVALLQLQARYTANHPAVEEMRTRLAEIRQALAKTSPTVETAAPVDPGKRAGIEAERRAAEQAVAELSAKVGTLQGIVVASDARRSDILDKEGVLEQLQDQINLKRAAYQELLTQLEAKQLTAASQQGRSSLVDPALLARASNPTLLRTLLFSLALGLFLGFALALLLETLDDTVRRPEDVTRDPDVRFLGVVPWTGEPTAALVVVEAPKSPPAEAFRTLRSNVNFATLDARPRTILVTSAGASEGKSVVAANLAVSYAQAGETVLIMDTDLRRPTQHHFFGVDARVGLTNVLVGERSLQEAIVPTSIERLSILPSGPLPPNPSELLDSARMHALLQEVQQVADIVILDSPPAIMLTDALILASQVDKTVLVAAAGQVTRDAFAEMVRLIRHARGDILGVVLNKLRLTTGDYYYYYYYYYYDESRSGRGRAPAGGGREPSGAPRPPRPADQELPF